MIVSLSLGPVGPSATFSRQLVFEEENPMEKGMMREV